MQNYIVNLFNGTFYATIVYPTELKIIYTNGSTEAVVIADNGWFIINEETILMISNRTIKIEGNGPEWQGNVMSLNLTLPNIDDIKKPQNRTINTFIMDQFDLAYKSLFETMSELSKKIKRPINKIFASGGFLEWVTTVLVFIAITLTVVCCLCWCGGNLCWCVEKTCCQESCCQKLCCQEPN